MAKVSKDLQLNRSERRVKRKRKLFRNHIYISILILCFIGATFLYGTAPGLEIRKMMVGTVISTQHAHYVKYMTFLLSKSEIEALRDAFRNPAAVQTASANHKKFSDKDTIKVDTIETVNYTAKVMTISDPTTVHLVESEDRLKGQGLIDLISQNNGVAGINAGGFVDPGGNGSGGQPIGTVISDGVLTNKPSANKKELMAAFLEDGEFITGRYTANELMELGVTQAVSFRPQLIVNGENVVTSEVTNAWGWAPRTAIGQAEDGSVVMVITDGRFYWNKTHRGASMSDIAEIMESYNVINAIAMDGGGSTTMMKDGELLLKPATETRIGMRYLPNAWVVIPND